MLKGAPEKIIAMCDKTFKKGQVHDMSKDDRQAIEDINELLAKRGERVLAFAQLCPDDAIFPWVLNTTAGSIMFRHSANWA